MELGQLCCFRHFTLGQMGYFLRSQVGEEMNLGTEGWLNSRASLDAAVRRKVYPLPRSKSQLPVYPTHGLVTVLT
jgi:hypothetical protein